MAIDIIADGDSAEDVKDFLNLLLLAQHPGALAQVMSALGQISQQVNGGQIELKGGTLADPPLKLGTVGFYSTAANTLSVAIAGEEKARLTATGLTIFGTITEV